MKHIIHRLLAHSLILVCLVSAYLLVFPAMAQKAQPQEIALLQDFCTTTLRIMPLGDSITKGSGGEVPDTELGRTQMISYRKDLWDSLVDTGYSFDFVGSLTNGEFYTGFDPSHEGHAGVTADYIQANVYSYLTANPADVILLHIGTNDIGTAPTPGQPIPEIVDEVYQILENIDSYEQANSVHITVILALIINRIEESQATHDFNVMLIQMAESRIAAGDGIIIVNMETGAGINYWSYEEYRSPYGYGDMYNNGSNGLHPYHTGYTKMAATWKQAIESLYQDCNQAPMVTGPEDQSSAELEQETLQIEASDPEGDTLTFQAQHLPPGLSINSSNGLISGQIDQDASQESPYTVNVVVTDNGSPSRSGQTTFSWTVYPRKLVFLPLTLFRRN